mgnify:CR=1 FL=1
MADARITVPARPQSTWASLSKGPGVTSQSSPLESTVVPSPIRAWAIKVVSRERRARPTTEGPWARAARTSARLVSDLLPGRVMVASTGPRARGAGHGSGTLGFTRAA